MTRREELEAGMPAPQVIIRLKTGVKRDGTLMALDAEVVIESGAFSGAVLAVSRRVLASLYKWPAFDVRGFEVLTTSRRSRPIARRWPAHDLRRRLAHGADRARHRSGIPSPSACATWSARAIRWPTASRG